MYVCVPIVCLVPVEARRRHWILWNWSYQRLRAAIWALETEHQSSERWASVLNLCSISPAPVYKNSLFKNTLHYCCFLALLCFWDKVLEIQKNVYSVLSDQSPLRKHPSLWPVYHPLSITFILKTVFFIYSLKFS